MMTNAIRVCAGLVTFNPDVNRLKAVVNSIIGQVEQLFIVDNGSLNINEIIGYYLHNEKIVFHLLPNNEGIAKALNRLCNLAFEHKYLWILTLDQDTICPSDIISCLIKGTKLESVGIVCPCVYYDGMNIAVTNKEYEIEEETACMTSASLTSIEAWRKVGGFKDDYFIDFVDNEFCMKLRLNNYRILRLNTCSINHQLGDTVYRRLLWKKIKGTSHKSWRIYYMIRNNILFIKEYKTHLNLKKEYLKLLYILCSELIFSMQTIKVVSYAWKGLIDAINNKSGKMS